MKMKKKFFAIALMLSILLGTGFSNSAYASANSCPPHGKYEDRHQSSTPWYTKHNVETGYTVNGVPIYKTCNVTHVGHIINVVCVKCNTKMDTYSYVDEYHSESHR